MEEIEKELKKLKDEIETSIVFVGFCVWMLIASIFGFIYLINLTDDSWQLAMILVPVMLVCFIMIIIYTCDIVKKAKEYKQKVTQLSVKAIEMLIEEKVKQLKNEERKVRELEYDEIVEDPVTLRYIHRKRKRKFYGTEKELALQQDIMQMQNARFLQQHPNWKIVEEGDEDEKM